MDLKIKVTRRYIVPLAELGDKTQLATFAFSADSNSRLSVFLGSASALVLTSLLAVVFGALMGKIIPPAYLRMGAGVLFLVLGVWMLVRGL